MGVALLDAERVRPEGDAWHELPVEPRPVEPGMLVYYQFRCLAGKGPEDHYFIYGPRPIGGRDWPSRFALCYRVLAD